MIGSTSMRVRTGSLALALVAAAGLVATVPQANAAGEDRLTDSAVTLSWSDGITGADNEDIVQERDSDHFMYEDFAGLELTVSQTTDIRAQALEVSWSGWEPTPGSIGKLPSNYLQFLQCWGDEATGPLPENCVWGASGMEDNGADGTIRGRLVADGDPLRDEVPEHYSNPAQGWLQVPFQPVTGDSTFGGRDDPFPFDRWTTNEIRGLRTDAEGNGEGVFTVHDAIDAPHLGCGAPVESAGGEIDGRDCWLVVVPHGVHRLDGSLVGGLRDADGSPLTPTLWNQRVQVHLDFAPLPGTCPTGAEQRPTVGSEFIAPAIESWQPALCADGGASYAYLPSADAEGRRQVSLTDPAAPGMAFTYAPVTGGTEVVHAPVAVSGLAIAFNIEEPDGTIIRDLTLTPRLVAKLLTQSYQYDVPGGYQGFRGMDESSVPEWVLENPRFLSQDPEFVELNPDVPVRNPGRPSVQNQLVVAGPDPADATAELWRWIQSDADAAAWLAGKPDVHGMVVNPSYTEFADPPAPDAFPKDIEACYDDPNPAVPEFCTLQQQPYADGLGGAALQAREGRSGTETGWDPNATSPSGEPGWWSEVDPQLPGRKWQLAVTDTASAQRYSLPVASLRNAAGEFVQPDSAGLQAGVAAMVPTDVDGVVRIDPEAESAGAYPLTMVTYAAVRADQEDDALADYAALLTHAAGPGQTPGLAEGQLPLGYAPLNEAMRDQTLAAAEALLADDGEEPDGPPDLSPGGDESGDGGGDESGDGGGDESGDDGGDESGDGGGDEQPADGAEAGVGDPPSGGTPLQPVGAHDGPGNGADTGADTGVDAPGGPVPGDAGGGDVGGPPPVDDAVPVALATPGEPVGPMQYALLAVLIVGLVGAIAGPAILRLGAGRKPVTSA